MTFEVITQILAVVISAASVFVSWNVYRHLRRTEEARQRFHARQRLLRAGLLLHDQYRRAERGDTVRLGASGDQPMADVLAARDEVVNAVAGLNARDIPSALVMRWAVYAARRHAANKHSRLLLTGLRLILTALEYDDLAKLFFPKHVAYRFADPERAHAELQRFGVTQPPQWCPSAGCAVVAVDDADKFYSVYEIAVPGLGNVDLVALNADAMNSLRGKLQPFPPPEA